ncbi:DNA breaking-rejoining enzyme [Armillaria novae-zelandiae]|uniref:DNA breaking-rejoining enzyme n=1 Tax=Armillaria novae-zelandiae TaxID=153914 RepID=A0AA39NJC3_9AGAR|nr:DNA breaking-rejoining enzyme [Armillaria novae-zelandiae]
MHGTSKGPKDVQRSYSYAQKLRAGTTYGFRRAGGRGKVPWDRATASGNPSISDLVSSYMLGLHKRKVSKGETATSARAIGPDILKQLYMHNHKPENWDNAQMSPGNWCGGTTRRLLQAVYLIAFTCLLCIDEVLNIQAHDIDVGNDDIDGTFCVTITLPFRKNSPFGDIPPFVLRALPKHMAHLCPARALATWIGTSKITHGYLFPHIDKRGRPITAKNSAMVKSEVLYKKPDVFLELFRNNLWDLGISPYVYGTHSFRRGGCQWLSCDLRWSIRQICEWGGWSSDFSHLTIVKYLISSNDNPTLRREEFFKLDRQVTKCWTCGRTCPCA